MIVTLISKGEFVARYEMPMPPRVGEKFSIYVSGDCKIFVVDEVVYEETTSRVPNLYCTVEVREQC